MSRRQTKRERINEALRDIRQSKVHTAFYRSFGTLHDHPDQPHITIPKDIAAFVKQEFDIWWDSWIETKLQEIEAVANPLSTEESDLIAGKAES